MTLREKTKKTKRSVTLYNDENVIMMLIINKIIGYAVSYVAMNYTFSTKVKENFISVLKRTVFTSLKPSSLKTGGHSIQHSLHL